MTVPASFALEWLRKDPNLVGIGIGARVADCCLVQESTCVSFLVKKKLTESTLRSSKAKSSLIPRVLRPRSQQLWGDMAGEEVETDVVEVGRFSGFAPSFNPGDVLVFVGSTGYALLGSILDLTSQAGASVPLVMTSAHATRSAKSKRAVLLDLATSTRAKAQLRVLAEPKKHTVVDAALLEPEPAAVQRLGLASDQGTLLKGKIRRTATSYKTTHVVRAHTIKRGQRYGAVARGREVKSIPVLMTDAIVKDVRLKGAWPRAVYRRQVITPKFLLPGESGSILHSKGRVAAMLNGGTTSASNIRFPANFWTPIEYVLARLLALSGGRELAFPQPPQP